MITTLYFKFFNCKTPVRVSLLVPATLPCDIDNITCDSFYTRDNDGELLEVNRAHFETFKRAFDYLNVEGSAFGLNYDAGVSGGLEKCAIRKDLV